MIPPQPRPNRLWALTRTHPQRKHAPCPQGVLKGFLPKGEQSDNHWVFVGGSRVAQLPQPRYAQPPAAK